MSNLGDILRTANRLPDAEPLLRTASAGLDRQLGPTDATSLRARAEEAESIQRRALDALRRSGKTRHPEYLSLLNNYAIMLPRRGEVDRAEAAFREILAIRREVLGPPHPETLMPMNNLADFLTSTGRVTESESLQREALGMLDRAPDRRATSEVAFMTRANLAEILAERGEMPEAERLYRAALDTALAVWGPDHSNTKIIQARLAEIRRPRPDGPTPRP